MDSYLQQILFVFMGLVLTSLVLGITLIAFGGDDRTITNNPRVVFEAHLAALDAGEWQLSDNYTKDECTISAVGGSESVLQKVLDGGFSYRRTFQIEDVWINEDGTKAILELQTAPDLPPVAILELVDEEWLIAC